MVPGFSILSSLLIFFGLDDGINGVDRDRLGVFLEKKDLLGGCSGSFLAFDLVRKELSLRVKTVEPGDFGPDCSSIVSSSRDLKLIRFKNRPGFKDLLEGEASLTSLSFSLKDFFRPSLVLNNPGD